MKNTKFSNPHGLSDKGNRSTAFDISFMAFHCLKDPHFKAIVNKQKHECVTYLKRRNILPRTQIALLSQTEVGTQQLNEEVPYRMVWLNSNKLLGIDGFKGVKTGITNTAGPCLCISYENTTHKHKLITVVLGCQNIDYRFRDARRLTLWADNMIIDKKLNARAPATAHKS